MAPRQKKFGDPCLGYWKSEHRFPYLKAAAQELGMTETPPPSERVVSQADELYSKKCASLAVRIFAIHKLMRMNLHLGMD